MLQKLRKNAEKITLCSLMKSMEYAVKSFPSQRGYGKKFINLLENFKGDFRENLVDLAQQLMCGKCLLGTKWIFPH